MLSMYHFLTTLRQTTVAGLCLALISSAFAQIQGMHTFANRREGTNVHPNALQDFTLIGVHRNFQAFSDKSTLTVSFFLPKLTGTSDRKVFVEATELQDSCHYFMEAKDSVQWTEGGWNTFGPWPTADIIDRLTLKAENIGVLAGYRKGSDPPVYLPVDVSLSRDKLPAQPYRIHFITGQDIQSLDITVFNSKGALVKVPLPPLRCNRSFNQNCKLYAAGSAQSFPLDMTTLPSGEYHVKFLGHVPSSFKPTSFDIVLYHHL